MVVDTDMHLFPPRTPRFTLLRVTDDPMPYCLALAGFLDVEMDQAARAVVRIAPLRPGGLRIAHPAETRPMQNRLTVAADTPRLEGDVLPGKPQATPRGDPRTGRGRRRTAQHPRP